MVRSCVQDEDSVCWCARDNEMNDDFRGKCKFTCIK